MIPLHQIKNVMKGEDNINILPSKKFSNTIYFSTTVIIPGIQNYWIYASGSRGGFELVPPLSWRIN